MPRFLLLILCSTLLPAATAASASAQLPVLADAPSAVLAHAADDEDFSSSNQLPAWTLAAPAELATLSFPTVQATTTTPQVDPSHAKPAKVPVDANGNLIPLERQQPTRILGFMPNFRTVSAGAKPHPPGWKYNFTVATHQATDYSTFLFLGLTSLYAEGTNAHPVLGKGADGFYAYAWRGFLDKTDGTYLSAWLLASLLHEDTRFYPLGNGHRIVTRELYVITRQGITRTYGGHDTPNIAGLGGKALTQYISRSYYPSGATSFSVLATKFGYSVMRDVIFSNIREFYPDIAAHYIRKHREKVAQEASNRDTTGVPAKP